MSLSTTLKLNILAAISEALDKGTRSYALNEAWTHALADGSGANQANKMYQDTAAATTTYDLDSTLAVAATGAGGGPTTSVSFTRIVAVAIKAAVANSAQIKVGGDFILTKYLVPGADTLSAVTIPVKPGGWFVFTAPDVTGVAVTASTGDEITVTVTGSDAFDILIIGS
jgi:hypothetical protein